MAIDEALLELVGEGISPPTMRFYTWERPWVSLGSGQTAAEIDRGACAERGWGILRRASGGTAVLHAGQVAYSVVLPAGHPLWAGDIAASYRRFAEPLREAFAALGRETELAAPGANRAFIANAPALALRICFGALGPYEHLVDGKKLVGNSQVRRRLASAQHGVIQVSGGQSALVELLTDASEAERTALVAYLEGHIGALATGQTNLAPATICAAITTAIPDHFKIQWELGKLTSAELSRTDQLVADKYGSDAWTYRR